MRRPHLKLVRALDAILLEGGELRERLLLRVRRDLAPLAVHRARPVCQCLRSSREVGGAKCHHGALETALKAVENRYRPCQARVSPSACNFARRNGAQVAAVESATPTDLATARLGTLRELRLLYLRGFRTGTVYRGGFRSRHACHETQVQVRVRTRPPRPRKRRSNRRTRDRNVVTLDSALSHSLHSLRSLSPVSCLLLVCLSLDGFHTRHPRFEVHVEVFHLGNVVVNALGWG